MRLLDTTTLELREFPDAAQCPPYAILSHVWVPGTETTFQDLTQFHAHLREASIRDPDTVFSLARGNISAKILDCCAFARAAGYRHLWADTCCIDKTSSAELSEAINSMCQWYSLADVCYAYLHDVDRRENPRQPGSRFQRSKWFTRGWTLQELVFPQVVVFLSMDWHVLGTRDVLAQWIAFITGVEKYVLVHPARHVLDSVSVSQRMSWAARRKTTRVEDEAYSLMGIFGVHMPIIYGEGRHAFIRLQEEITKRIPDQSLFAWGPCAYLRPGEFSSEGGSGEEGGDSGSTAKGDSTFIPTSHQYAVLFAPSPSHFAHCPKASPIATGTFLRRLGLPPSLPPEFLITGHGVRTRFPLMRLSSDGSAQRDLDLAILACEDDQRRLLALVLCGDRPTGSYDISYHFDGPQKHTGYVQLSKYGAVRILALSVGQYAPTRRKSQPPDVHAVSRLPRPTPLSEAILSGSIRMTEVRIPKEEPADYPHERRMRRRWANSQELEYAGPCTVFLPPWTAPHLQQAGLTLECAKHDVDALSRTGAALAQVGDQCVIYAQEHGTDHWLALLIYLAPDDAALRLQIDVVGGTGQKVESSLTMIPGAWFAVWSDTTDSTIHLHSGMSIRLTVEPWAGMHHAEDEESKGCYALDIQCIIQKARS